MQHGFIDRLLMHSLDAVALRQQHTANNIANANTPGYKRQTVRFEDWLARSLGVNGRLPLSRTHPGHLGRRSEGSAPAVVTERSTSMRNDGNNVDVEREMAQLAQDTVLYSALAEQVGRRYAAVRTAIDGRR